MFEITEEFFFRDYLLAQLHVLQSSFQEHNVHQKLRADLLSVVPILQHAAEHVDEEVQFRDAVHSLGSTLTEMHRCFAEVLAAPEVPRPEAASTLDLCGEQVSDWVASWKRKVVGITEEVPRQTPHDIMRMPVTDVFQVCHGN